MPGTLFVVATPIGNLEDITARALRVLGSVALIAAEDTRRTAKLLGHFGIGTKTISLHEHNEASKAPALVARLLSGDDIALVSDAGTPTISDPGQRLVQAAADRGIRVEPVPGASAVLAFLSASGLGGDAFTFLGFPPTRLNDRDKWFRRLMAVDGVAVFFESPHRITETLRTLQERFGDVQAVMGRELTKVHEELARGPISQLLTRLSAPRGEYVVGLVIGQSTINNVVEPPQPERWAEEIGQIANERRLSTRKATTIFARRLGLPPNEVYTTIVAAKKSIK